MRKLFLTVLIVGLFLIKPTSVLSEKIAGTSAAMTYKDSSSEDKDLFVKKLAIKNVLAKHNSQLEEQVDTFIDTCVEYKLDCYLLPSITGVESYFAKFIYPNSNNPFGWGGGLIMFDDWKTSIKTVGEGLKKNYVDKGAKTVDEIGPIYAVSTTWAPKVNHFIAEFRQEEEKIQLFLGKNQVE
jgi:hypothetical protein